MPDPRFHTRSGEYTLGDLADRVGAALRDPADSARIVTDVAPLDEAGPEHLSFIDNLRYRESFKASRAGACFVSPQNADLAPEGMALLVTPAPYKAYARAAQIFYPDLWPEPGIDSTARIAPTARIASGVRVDANAVIEDGADIGSECWIEANAVIGRGVVMGERCRIGACATLSHAILGDRVRIYTGARIGQDGFGFAIDPSGHVKVPQLGRVMIGSDVEIGANTTIDRGAGPDTVIGQGCWIDNLVQIGHNVKIGRGCILVAQVGVAGSSVIEDYAVLAGQVGVAGHLRIGKAARIAAQSGIMRDVPPGEEMMGSPAVPIRQHMRQVAALGRLVQKKKAGSEADGS